jgi:MFS family permease
MHNPSITKPSHLADFRKLWIGQGVSEVGSRVSRDGLPLLAVLILGATPADMGTLTAIGASATLVFGLAAGVWVDRLRRRPVMIAADLARAALLSTIPVAALLHVLSLAQLYVVVALTGVLTVFFDVSYQSLVPALVSREHLLQSNSRLAATSAAAEVAGPGITGILVQTITAPFAILLDAVSFAFSAVMIAWIRTPEPAPQPQQHDSLWLETTAGLRFVAAQPLLRAIATWSVFFSFFASTLGPLYVLYAIRVLHLSPVQLGIVIATGGVGSLIGSTLAPRIGRALGPGRTLLLCSVAIPVGFVLIPLAHGSAVTAMAFLMAQQLFGDTAYTTYIVTELSLRQRLAPDQVLGRVNAAMQLLSRGMWPLGALAGGWLATVAGIRFTLFAAVAGVAVSALWLVFSPVRTATRD